MNETTRLVLKILATVALVVIVYMAFSYLAAAVIAPMCSSGRTCSFPSCSGSSRSTGTLRCS